MNKEDVRWQQRFKNFNKAFAWLKKFVGHDDLNELDKQGLIKAFKYTYELIWKTLQDLLKEKSFYLPFCFYKCTYEVFVCLA